MGATGRALEPAGVPALRRGPAAAMSASVDLGDCLPWLRALPAQSVDAVVCYTERGSRRRCSAPAPAPQPVKEVMVQDQNSTQEVWRTVPGWTLYQVSTHGRLRSLHWDGTRVLKGGVDKDGYPRAVLCENGRRESWRRAHLVALAFLGPRPFKGAVLRHMDGSRDNDRPTNLAWGTQADNIADKARHGTQLRGATHPRAIISEATAREIISLGQAGVGGMGIARRLQVSRNVVYPILYNRSWKHLAR